VFLRKVPVEGKEVVFVFWEGNLGVRGMAVGGGADGQGRGFGVGGGKGRSDGGGCLTARRGEGAPLAEEIRRRTWGDNEIPWHFRGRGL